MPLTNQYISHETTGISLVFCFLLQVDFMLKPHSNRSSKHLINSFASFRTAFHILAVESTQYKIASLLF